MFPNLIIECSNEVSFLLGACTNNYQYCIQLMEIPKEWKIANVVPIHKKGDMGELTDYQSLSLISICCKVLEYIFWVE